MDNVNIFKTGIAALAAGLTFLFGEPDIWIVALIVLVIIDYLTGWCKGFITGNLSSAVGFRGIVKKVMYFALVAVAAVLDVAAGASGAIRVAVIGFLVANEGLSIMENCAGAGLPIPKVLVDALEVLKGDNGGRDKDS